MNIAKAAPTDVAEIVGGIAELVRSSSFRDMQEFRPEVAAETVRRIVLGDNGLALTMRRDGHFAGTFLGFKHENAVSGDPMCGELFFWTDPKSRGHGLCLLRQAEETARESGCRIMSLSHPASAMRVGELYKRVGYELTELVYRKAL